MQLLMEQIQAIILCQAGQEDECRPLAESLRTILSHTLGPAAVMVGKNWDSATSQDAMALCEAISDTKVVISLFGKTVEKNTTIPAETIWKRTDEHAWYNCLTYQGPPQQRPKYIPICLQNTPKREYFAQHLRTLRIGHIPKDWAFQLLSKPKSDWDRSLTENLKSVIKALNNALGIKLTLEDLLINITFGKKDSEKKGAEHDKVKPQSAIGDTRLMETPGAGESKPAESATFTQKGTPLIDYECTSEDTCTVRVTCSKVNKFSIEPAKDKTVVSMNVQI